MKRILIILIAFLMISTVAAIDTTDWSTINLKGKEFNLPPKYQNGEYLTDSYEKENFKLLCVDDMLNGNYGFIAKIATKNEDLTINGHPAKYIQYGEGYSRIYFAVDNSIYSITWKGSKITPEIEEIIGSSASPAMSNSKFYNLLDQACKNYQKSQNSITYDMDPYDDIEDYEEYSAYDDIGEISGFINTNFYCLLKSITL